MRPAGRYRPVHSTHDEAFRPRAGCIRRGEDPDLKGRRRNPDEEIHEGSSHRRTDHDPHPSIRRCTFRPGQEIAGITGAAVGLSPSLGQQRTPLTAPQLASSFEARPHLLNGHAAREVRLAANDAVFDPPPRGAGVDDAGPRGRHQQPWSCGGRVVHRMELPRNAPSPSKRAVALSVDSRRPSSSPCDSPGPCPVTGFVRRREDADLKGRRRNPDEEIHDGAGDG